ncbi:lecithin retinol acyltransferase family protein [Flagellimonas meridianipacifica]|uniref:Lecithin:retinol acyltransferase n=1 Tax=Flagellimonas meridianipacifica TaxID=1080225 RepID=A0A2T0MIW1_9FLAO|nr:lecithin retinol acyltransferase family protein [Allomuricauda pacifica]PRX57527.1 lecithin:retinol acyltransferase [Allomuricauda pacifica]
MKHRLLNSPNLFPGDVIVAKKRRGISRVLDHYVVFVGNGTFIGNLKGSVRLLLGQELLQLLEDYEPVRIRHFIGSANERQHAINRAYSKLGHRYSLLGYNCEHFANWVQFGKAESSQVTNGFLILIGALALRLAVSDE